MNKNRLSNQALFLLISKNAQSIAVLILSIIIIRVLSKFEYGTFQQVNLIAMTSSLIMIFGIPYSIYYFIPRLIDKKEFLIQNFIVLSILGIISSITLFLLQDKICLWMNNLSLKTFFIIICVYAFALVPYQIIEPMFISMGRTNLYSWVNIALAIIQIAIVGTAILISGSLKAILLGMTGFSLFAYMVILVFILSIHQKIGRILNYERIKDQFKYSFPLGLSGINSTFCTYLDQYIISWFYKPERFAVYARGAMEVPFISALSAVVMSVATPNFVRFYSNNDVKGLMDLWNESIRKMCLVLFPVFIFFFIVADEVITFIYTDNYLESAIIFKIYLFLIPLRVIGSAVILRAMGRTKENFYSSILFLITNFIISIILVKSVGLVGPAISTIISFSLANWGYLLSRMAKELLIPYHQICQWMLMLKIMAISLLPASVCFFIPTLALSKLGIIVLCAVVYFPCYLGLLLIFKMLTRDDIDLINGWLRIVTYKKKTTGD